MEWSLILTSILLSLAIAAYFRADERERRQHANRLRKRRTEKAERSWSGGSGDADGTIR